MISRRQRVYNRKHYFTKQLRALDKEILRLLRDERAGDMEVPITAYVDVAKEVLQLGQRGEDIVREAVKYGLGDALIYEMRDKVNTVQTFSHLLKQVAESKWFNNELPTFPTFTTILAPASELVVEADSVREMKRELERGGEK